MIVRGVVTRYDHDHTYLWKAGDITEIKLQLNELGYLPNPCCEDMAKAWDERAIGFGDFDTMLNRDPNVNIYRCHPYAEGAAWDSVPIKVCPFCAEPIVVELEEARPQA